MTVAATDPTAQTIADLAASNAAAQAAIDAAAADSLAARNTNAGLAPIAARLQTKRATVAALTGQLEGLTR